MADRQGGKRGDAGTKQDQPSEQAGKGTPAKEELETQQAAQAAGQEEAVEKAKPKPKRAPRRKPAEAEAEGTAAAETGVDKDAAEVEKPKRTRTRAKAAAEPEPEPEAEAVEAAEAPEAAAETTEAEPAEEEAPKPRARGSRGGRGRGAAKPAAEPEPAKPEHPATGRRRDREALTGQRPVVRAQAKYVRTSARKARLVCDHIRGKSVDEARAILAYTPRAAARDWSKLLESAVANAEHNHELVGDDLKVLAAFADEGPTLKRFRPRAMGRATRIRKRTSHLTIQLTPKE